MAKGSFYFLRVRGIATAFWDGVVGLHWIYHVFIDEHEKWQDMNFNDKYYSFNAYIVYC